MAADSEMAPAVADSEMAPAVADSEMAPAVADSAPEPAADWGTEPAAAVGSATEPAADWGTEPAAAAGSAPAMAGSATAPVVDSADSDSESVWESVSSAEWVSDSMGSALVWWAGSVALAARAQAEAPGWGSSGAETPGSESARQASMHR